MVKNFRYGLLGLGNLGGNVLRQVSQRKDDFPLYWVADSSRVVHRRDGERLSASDIAKIIRAKGGLQGLDGLAATFVVTRFSGAREESRVLGELIEPARVEWVVLDTSYLDAHGAQTLASGFMGVLAICTANKTAWSDPSTCANLFSRAQKHNTFLGLNCTQGVGIDQMEYIPVAAARLGRKTIRVQKRDNSSLNLLFSRTSEGLSPDRIFRALSDGGYLEPGGMDLLPEVKDQQIKARITVNVCAILDELKVTSRAQSVVEVLETGPGSAKVSDLCAWHATKRRGGYPSLVTEIVMDGNSGTITYSLSFVVLERNHPLGRSFNGANVFSITVADHNESFVHRGGPGGSINTARNLLREADEVMRLSGERGSRTFSQIPVLTGLSSGDREIASRTRSLLKILR